jgi:hypothetical protein
MRNEKWGLYILTLLFATCSLFFVLGCENFFEPPKPKKAVEDRGTFSLEIGGVQTGRTILPTTVQSSFALYTLVFSSSGRDDVSVDRTNTNLGNAITLAVATWNLTVTAYMDSGKTRPIAQGSMEGIVIRTGENTSRSLELKPIIEEGATGTFSWNINYPTDVTIASVTITPLIHNGTPEQTLYFIGGTPGVDTIVNKNNSASPLTLNTGYYQVVFNLSNGKHDTGREEYLHIYQNMLSRFEYTFTQGHFTVYSVTNGDNSGPGSLRHAIMNVASNSTILIENGVETIVLMNRLEINKNLIIAGNGVTITRDTSWTTIGSSSQLMYISGSSIEVTISRIHYKDSRATYGAAIYNGSGNLTLESCIFSGNQTINSNADGGAIYNSGTINVKGCTFYNNSSAPTNSGYGGAIYNSSGTLTLTGNLFYGNTAYTGPIVYRYNGTVTSGGYNVADVPMGTGTAQSGWSAVETDKTVSGVQVAPVSFKLLSGNQTANVIADLPAGYPAVDFYGSPITASMAAGAVQSTANGYAVDLSVNFNARGSTSIITEPNADGLYSGTVTIAATLAEGSKFHIYWLVNDTKASSTNPLELTITAHTKVQAVFARIVDNFTSDDAATEGTLRHALSNAVSNDVIYLSGVTPGETTISLTRSLGSYSDKDVTIEGNGITITRADSWSAINNTSQLMSITYNTVTIRCVHFKDGRATSGAAIINGDGGKLTLESCIFSGNNATEGGAIYNSGILNVKGCTFYNNSAFSGGAIYNYFNNLSNTGALTFTGNLFYGNTASSSGPVVGSYIRSGTVTSDGYNVVDKAMGTGTTQTLSGWTAKTGDKYITDIPLSSETFQQLYISDGALNVFTTLPAGYPTVDFYGDPITNGAAAGAVQSLFTNPLNGTISITGNAYVYETLVADISLLEGDGTISYQWKRNGTVNIGTNSSTYTVQTDDIGSTITVTVTRYFNSNGVTSEPTATVILLPLTGTVSIAGTAQVNQTLTADIGLLEGSGTISYQWKKNGTINIGTNSSTYTIQTADIGSTITVTVTRSHNADSVTSTPTAAVILPILIEPLTGLANKLAWLQTNAQSNTSYILEVDANESINPHTLSYGDRRGIIITLKGVGANRVIGLSSNGSMFTVSDTITLVLESNITLQGLDSNNNSLVYVDGGTFIMNGGKISGNSHSSSRGGGVYVDGGTFTMNGGEISGNSARSYSVSGVAYGGGVYVDGGTFTMNGGEISGNSATASYAAYGGGVYGTFTMYNGKISGNSATASSPDDFAFPAARGGGVYGNLNMYDGEISNNTTTSYSYSSSSSSRAYAYGGGVYVYSGTPTMNGGKISGNSATASGINAYAYGGGVYAGGGTPTMNGGKISGNSATATGSSASAYGGGVYAGGGTFTMNEGEISGNSANSGGGVYVNYSSSSSYGTFRIVTGTIYGLNESVAGLRNTANSGGMSLFKNGNGIAQYGTFTGNTWGSNGDLITANNTIKVVNGVLISNGTGIVLNSVTANGSITQNTTQLTLTFDQVITGLSVNDITLSGVSGIQKGTLSGSGPTYTLSISGFTSSGTLTVAVAKTGYEITGTPKTVDINYLTPVTFNSVTANGSSTQTTTQLTLTFSQAITGLTADDITLSNVSGVQKGTLSGSGPTYTLPISGFTSSGTLNVRVSKGGYAINSSQRSVDIFYSASVTLSSVTANGSSTQPTTQLTLTFSQAISGLNANDITLSGVSGVSKGTLISGTGSTYILPIDGFTEGGTLTVSVAKGGYNISGSPKTVTVYYIPSVTFNSVIANGSSIETTTQLTLTFSSAFTGLTANDITLSGVSGVSKGTLSRSGATYTLRISGFSSGGSLTVSVAKSGIYINNSSRTVTIYHSRISLYSAGNYHYYENSRTIIQACYWQGTTRIDLPSSNGSNAEAITVAGGVVYTAGFYNNTTGTTTACYWQGTTRTDLPGYNAVANAITVTNGTVYTAGSSYDVAGNLPMPCYWQGTTRIDLPVPAGTSQGIATAITVVGGTVYTAGRYAGTSSGSRKLCYWRGTTRVDLPVTTGGSGYNVSAITVVDGTVYTAGNYSYNMNEQNHNLIACYWQGTTRTDLTEYVGPNFDISASVNDIFVVDGTVYTAGFHGSGPTFWRGTTQRNLPTSPGTTGTVQAITVKDGIVYMFGWGSDTCLWQGTTSRTSLGDMGMNSNVGTGRARFIVVE